MRNRTKLIFATLTATALMALAVGNATATRIQFSNSSFRIVWTSLELISFGTQILCPVTLEGGFSSRTILKIASALIGQITSAYVGATCTGGSLRALTETLPWHIQYSSFTGTLPVIRSIRFMFVGFRLRVLNARETPCLFGTTQEHPAAGEAIVEEGTARSLRVDEGINIPLEHTPFLCFLAGEGHLRGTAEVFLQGSVTVRITVRLVL